MCSLCDKKLCKSRKFGIGQEIIFPNLTDLQVVNLEKPYYYMNVDGDRLYLDSAKHLTNQTMFQEECVKQLRLNPPTLKTNDWKKLTNILLTNAEMKNRTCRRHKHKRYIKKLFRRLLCKQNTERLIKMTTKIYEMVVRIPKMAIITLYLTTSLTTIYQENIGRCHTKEHHRC